MLFRWLLINWARRLPAEVKPCIKTPDILRLAKTTILKGFMSIKIEDSGSPYYVSLKTSEEINQLKTSKAPYPVDDSTR